MNPKMAFLRPLLHRAGLAATRRHHLLPNPRHIHKFIVPRFKSTNTHSHYKYESWSENPFYWAVGSAAAFGPLVYYVFAMYDDDDKRKRQKEYFKIVPPTTITATQTTPTTTKDDVIQDAKDTLADTTYKGPHYKYILVGTGTASYHAIQAILKKDPDADILVIGNENDAFYQRPPLSKELWLTDAPDASQTLLFKDWKGKTRSIFYTNTNDDRYRVLKSAEEALTQERTNGQISLLIGTEVVGLDLDAQMVELKDGTKFKYDKVMLATGGTPKRLQWMDEADPSIRNKLTTFRSVQDFQSLHDVVQGGKKVVVVGGGFLGSELASALVRRKDLGISVSQVYPEEGNLSLVLPKYLTQWTTSKLKQDGVEVITKNYVVKASPSSSDPSKVSLELSDGKTLDADHVVVAAGISPNTSIAKNAGLEIDETHGGIVVNAELKARANVYGAGDVISYHDIALGRRRTEHYDHAVMSGKVAGNNMAGEDKPYKHQPLFWSDLGPEISFQAVGLLDSRLPTVGAWKLPKDKVSEPGKEDFEKGVVFYTKDKKVVGVLMWNLHNKVNLARKIIREGKVYEDVNELGTLFNLEE